MSAPRTPNLNVPLTPEDNALLLELRAIKERELQKRISVSEVVRLMIRETHQNKATSQTVGA